VRPEGLSLKNCSDTIGNRTRDLPTFGAMPQLTAPPHTLQGVEGRKLNTTCLQPTDGLSLILHTDKVTQIEQSSSLLLLSVSESSSSQSFCRYGQASVRYCLLTSFINNIYSKSIRYHEVGTAVSEK